MQFNCGVPQEDNNKNAGPKEINNNKPWRQE
jgi:hypothetical protein